MYQLATCFFWIKKAGKIVDKAVKERESEDKKAVESIEVLEMDELYTYIKKNLERIFLMKMSVRFDAVYMGRGLQEIFPSKGVRKVL